MEIHWRSKLIPRRLLLMLYCCLSVIFFCALCQYSFSNSKPETESSSEMVSAHWTKKPPNSTNPMHQDSLTRNFLDVQKIDHKDSAATVNRTGGSSILKYSRVEEPLSISTFSLADAESQKTSVLQETPLDNGGQQSKQENSCTSITAKPKLILLWTPFFGSWDYMPSGPFHECPSCPNCRTTNNRSLLLESDAVVFHARDMSLADIPVQRTPNQRWIFYCMESPQYSDFPGLQFMKKMFNWTMTYRPDSDIYNPYGVMRKIYPIRKLDLGALRDSWERKTKSVVWMSSHCPTLGGRDAFVDQLKTFIDVEEFGSCGTLNCPRDSTKKCLSDFAENYKFFLAFENSICNDYITEKFFRTLKYNIIPVVFGGAKYQKLAPPGSYIDALGFKSPKHLAYFLTGVGKDFALYSSYFQWRKEYESSLEVVKECTLCSHLHDKTAKRTVYEDMRQWWINDGNCRTWQGNT